MNRRKAPYFFIVVVPIMLVTGVLNAQDTQVDRDELASIGNQSVTFINYVGPYEFTNTLDQIRNIGRSIGEQISPEKQGEASWGNKYRIIHVVDPGSPDKLDADIFILEGDAAVDHIVNLRHILAGYLETSYGISGRDAYLMAEFITYYNAVYRGDKTTVAKRYKQAVLRVLETEKIGLDTHYSNWAGQTQILVPLRSSSKELKVDTDTISGQEVVEEMRQEEDRGIESREQMVELREKELDKEQESLNKQREKLERQDKTITQQLEKIEEKDNLNSSEEQQKVALEEEKQSIESEKAAIREEQKDIDERTQNVLEMRDDIAEDKNDLLQEEKTQEKETPPPSPVAINPVWFLSVDAQANGIPFGRVMKYNIENGEKLAVSKITAVRGRTLVLLSDDILIIAGKEGANAKVRPMLLDRDTLELKKEGSHNVFPGSLITVNNGNIYLITTADGEWRLGKFNTNLDMLAISESAVEPWSSVSFEEDFLFVQGEGRSILKLSTANLSEEARLE